MEMFQKSLALKLPASSPLFSDAALQAYSRDEWWFDFPVARLFPNAPSLSSPIRVRLEPVSLSKSAVTGLMELVRANPSVATPRSTPSFPKTQPEPSSSGALVGPSGVSTVLSSNDKHPALPAPPSSNPRNGAETFARPVRRPIPIRKQPIYVLRGKERYVLPVHPRACKAGVWTIHLTIRSAKKQTLLSHAFYRTATRSPTTDFQPQPSKDGNSVYRITCSAFPESVRDRRIEMALRFGKRRNSCASDIFTVTLVLDYLAVTPLSDEFVLEI